MIHIPSSLQGQFGLFHRSLGFCFIGQGSSGTNRQEFVTIQSMIIVRTSLMVGWCNARLMLFIENGPSFTNTMQRDGRKPPIYMVFNENFHFLWVLQLSHGTSCSVASFWFAVKSCETLETWRSCRDGAEGTPCKQTKKIMEHHQSPCLMGKLSAMGILNFSFDTTRDQRIQLLICYTDW